MSEVAEPWWKWRQQPLKVRSVGVGVGAARCDAEHTTCCSRGVKFRKRLELLGEMYGLTECGEF